MTLFPPSGVVLFSGYPFFDIIDDSYLLTLISGNYGSSVKIFETNTELFVYRLGSLLRYNGDFTYAGMDCSNICETSSGLLVAAMNDSYRRLTRINSAVHTDVTLIFSSETVLSGFVSRAMISDNTYSVELPTLVGNGFESTYPRISRNDLNSKPIGDFTKSDVGIPQVTPDISIITVLEAV